MQTPPPILRDSRLARGCGGAATERLRPTTPRASPAAGVPGAGAGRHAEPPATRPPPQSPPLPADGAGSRAGVWSDARSGLFAPCDAQGWGEPLARCRVTRGQRRARCRAPARDAPGDSRKAPGRDPAARPETGAPAPQHPRAGILPTTVTTDGVRSPNEKIQRYVKVQVRNSVCSALKRNNNMKKPSPQKHVLFNALLL